MANDLTSIMPKILARGLRSLREQVILTGLVNFDYSTEAKEKGDTIDIPVASSVTIEDVVPSNVLPAGEDSAPFPVLELEPTEQRCAQFRDLVKPGTMTEGSFRYEVRVLEKDSETAAVQMEFAAVEPGG